MKRVALVAAVITAMMTLSAYASSGDIQAGKKKAATCETCHGEGGHSQTDQFPILAGQYEDYLIHAMRDYRSGARKNAVMNGMAAGLSDQDIKSLAAYFASQKTHLYTPSVNH